MQATKRINITGGQSISLIVTSALLLWFAYLNPDYLNVLVFVFLIPLFYLVYVTPQRRSCSHWALLGFLWGLLFFSLHWISFITLFLHHTYGPFRYLIYPLLVLYASVWTALWFLSCALLSQLTILSWLVGTISFVYLFEHYGLVPFGCSGGYPFINPVMLLAADYRWCTTMHWFTAYGLLMLLVLFQFLCAYIVVTKQWWLSCFASLVLVPFLYGWFSEDKISYAREKDMFCPLLLPEFSCSSYLEAAQEITDRLISAPHNTMQEGRVFVMAESSFPFCLNKHQVALDMWRDNVLTDEDVLVIGAYFEDEADNIYNSVYIIKQCRITQIYSKKYLMPFIEHLLEPLHNIPILHSTFFQQNRPFSAGNTEQGNLLYLGPLSKGYVLAICSEFFLHRGLYSSGDGPMILLVNDRWFDPSFQYVMYLYACLHAYELHIPIIYLGSSSFHRIYPPSYES